MKAMSITALAIAMAFATGCGPSEQKGIDQATVKREPTERERFEATEKLLSAWDPEFQQSRASYIRVLISEGADVNAKNEAGLTSLFRACYRGHLEIVTLLVEAGADVNVKEKEGVTPLMSAAIGYSTPEIVTLLIDAGADVNAKNKYGETSLMFACDRGHLEIVTLLAEAGADVNAKCLGGKTPLNSCSNEAVKELLKAAGATE